MKTVEDIVKSDLFHKREIYIISDLNGNYTAPLTEDDLPDFYHHPIKYIDCEDNILTIRLNGLLDKNY